MAHDTKYQKSSNWSLKKKRYHIYKKLFFKNINKVHKTFNIY